jgi:hypothetical protein
MKPKISADARWGHTRRDLLVNVHEEYIDSQIVVQIVAHVASPSPFMPGGSPQAYTDAGVHP